MTAQTMFGDEIQTAKPAPTLSKKGFAEALGVSPGRVSQLITAGLPTLPNGRIDREVGLAWYRANVDSNRARAAGAAAAPAAAPGEPMTSRAARDQAEAEISRLKAERLAGRHIDRRATMRVIEARAKYERDAWLGWVSKTAPALAAATGADTREIMAFLDREVREQLVTIASTPVELPK